MQTTDTVSEILLSNNKLSKLKTEFMDALKRFSLHIYLLILLFSSSLTHAGSDTAVNLDASIGLDDNVTRAQLNEDIEHDSFVSITASLVHEAVNFDTGQIVVNLDLSATEFFDFSGLSNAAAGGGVNYTFSPWASFGAPWFSLDLQYKVQEFDSFLRDSDLFVGTFTFGKRLDDRTDMRAAVMYQSRESEGVAFDTKNTSFFINFDFQLENKMTLYTTYKYQDGDVFSSANQSMVSIYVINEAKAIEFDDVFNGKLAYRLDGTTQFFTVGLNIARNLDSAYDVSVRFLSSEADGNLEYEDLAVRLSYFRRIGIEF